MFHGSRKSIRNSVKYCFADASPDYMHFLEECSKAEEEGKVGQAKAATKAKVAAATAPHTKEDELNKQLKYQQHQTDALVGQVKGLVVSHEDHTSLLQWGQARWFWEANPRHMERGLQGKGPAFADPIPSHSPAKS